MTATPRRSSYHHGDLRATLLREAIAVAQTHGPYAVTLREITRRAGVTVNAAYRHFADRADLMDAVAGHAQSLSARAMEQRIATATTITASAAHAPAAHAPAAHAPAAHAPDGHELLRCVGLGYIDFARAEPGLFQAAYLEPVDLTRATNPATAGDSGRTAYQLLGDALDQMVTDGELDPARRPHAEVPAWSAVHGFAMLVVQGPLRELPAQAVTPLAERVVEAIIVGLTQV